MAQYVNTVCSVSQAGSVPDLDFDIDLPPWSKDTGSTCTGNTTEHSPVPPLNWGGGGRDLVQLVSEQSFAALKER